jgi:hypothetical protein
MKEPSAFMVGAGVVMALAPKGLGNSDTAIRFAIFLVFIVFALLFEQVLP